MRIVTISAGARGCGVALCSKLVEQVGFWEMQVSGGLLIGVSRGLRVLCWVLRALMFGWVEFYGRMVGEGYWVADKRMKGVLGRCDG